jgi:hypothetical protein
MRLRRAICDIWVVDPIAATPIVSTKLRRNSASKSAGKSPWVMSLEKSANPRCIIDFLYY